MTRALSSVRATAPEGLADAAQARQRLRAEVEQELRDQVRRELTATAEGERQRLAQARAVMEAAAEALGELYASASAELEAQAVELAFEIAGKVLMQHVEAGKHEIDPIVRELLKRVPGDQAVTVRLNPADFARSQAGGATGASGGSQEPPVCSPGANGVGGAEQNVKIVSDPRVPPAGAVVETRDGTVEVTPAESLARLREALTAADGAGA